MAYSADKRNIIAGIANTLRTAIGCPVFEYFKWLDQINDFPSICLHIETDYKSHIESTPNVVGGDFNMIIRGYLHSENVVAAQDDFIQQIEDALNALTPATAIQIDDIHINSLEHDEGLFEPYGTVTINVDIAYRHAED
jgi:hypothetical protein